MCGARNRIWTIKNMMVKYNGCLCFKMLRHGVSVISIYVDIYFLRWNSILIVVVNCTSWLFNWWRCCVICTRLWLVSFCVRFLFWKRKKEVTTTYYLLWWIFRWWGDVQRDGSIFTVVVLRRFPVVRKSYSTKYNARIKLCYYNFKRRKKMARVKLFFKEWRN